jgi:hypothetical protein
MRGFASMATSSHGETEIGSRNREQKSGTGRHDMGQFSFCVGLFFVGLFLAAYNEADGYFEKIFFAVYFLFPASLFFLYFYEN